MLLYVGVGCLECSLEEGFVLSIELLELRGLIQIVEYGRTKLVYSFGSGRVC
jgi:hypothetical protein